MRKKRYKLLPELSFFSQFRSPMPPHLTPEEQAEWEKELQWERKEYQRRKKEGLYPYED